MTPKERSLRARAAAHAMHARNNGRDVTAAAREGFYRRFLAQVPEDLPDAERHRRAEHLRREYMAKLALASARARRKKRDAA